MAARMIKKEIEKGVTNTLDGLKTGQIDEDSLFAQQDVMDLGVSTKKPQNEHADKIAKKIKSKVEFEVTEIETDEEQGTAKIKITAPNAVKILKQIADSMKEEDFELLYSEFEKALDEKEVPTKEFIVQSELKLIDDTWVLIPNSELNNAYSGGLNEAYFAIGKQKVQLLLGKDEVNE